MVGGLVVLAIIAVAAWWFMKRKRPQHKEDVYPYPPILAGADSPYSSPNMSFTGSGVRVGGMREKASLREPAPLPVVSTVPPSYAPPSTAVEPSASAPAPVPVDVDRIIELIAQRIDRPAGSAPSADPYAPPPQYPAHGEQ